MEDVVRVRKNPSRETCEGIIKRILTTEVLQSGANRHFKSAADFMNYFESLYPASDALNKQVQRAIKSLNMPKDELGYFMVNKTMDQFEQEQEISNAFHLAGVSIDPMENAEAVFISAAPHMCSYIMHLLRESTTFQGKYVAIIEAANGLVIYTTNKNQLLILLNSLIKEGT